jgi:dihydrofolate reductase
MATEVHRGQNPTGTTLPPWARSEGDIYLFGGAETVAAFARLDLIDEYQLFVHPIVLGGGVPLFPALDHRQSMSVVEARVFDGTVTGLRYRRER